MKILFIHGYLGGAFGSTATELQKQLGDRATLFAPAFSNQIEQFENILSNISQAQELVNEKGIDLVIGSSMGGFTALRVHGVPRIVINPCIKISERFTEPHFPSTTTEEIEKYRAFEEQLSPTTEERENTWGLFSLEDELFSYLPEFQKLYDPSHALRVAGEHRNNPHRIRDHIIPLIDHILSNK